MKEITAQSWIRINQLGYTPKGIKVAVWCTKSDSSLSGFELIDAKTSRVILKKKAETLMGAYGPFTQTCRLDFTLIERPGHYYLKAGSCRSPEFEIGADVYKGSADFCLRYMRQQRSGFNPFLKDSCHTRDGYTLYGPMKDSSFVPVSGGWHDASDYLQYATTSANATAHLLMAYRDFPSVFTDEQLANGLDGRNDIPDILDEAKWGIDWLLKMHPGEDLLFNQVGDDRDHAGMRIPKEDSFYGKGIERPVYFVSGQPQQRGKFMNNTTGTSSTAAKFASAFALASELLPDTSFNTILQAKAMSAFRFAHRKLGVTQTASVRSPYIYAEDNWTDDLELAAAELASLPATKQSIEESRSLLQESLNYARKEPVTPWLGKDTAAHYQWYPFINLGHYELAKQLTGQKKESIINYYKEGIEAVWQKAKKNAFYRAIPFIWCSNNLTVSFAIQCKWYETLSGDQQFDELAQSNIDWIFGCNPWGTSMVYGLPSKGDTPTDPHSAFTHLKNYPIDGGLVDGPVYTSIYKNLIGITLYEPDEYAPFQSELAVYHDDYGDYSSNEPTMDGTASLIYLLAMQEANASTAYRVNWPSVTESNNRNFTYSHGAIIRGDSTIKKLAIVFTGHEFGEGLPTIIRALEQEKINASFFLTGTFLENPAFSSQVRRLRADGNYIGPHSGRHLLYCDWKNRDSLLVNERDFQSDLFDNLGAMRLKRPFYNKEDLYFLPPYEWYNDSIAVWASRLSFQLINLSPGTLSAADYTTLKDANYRSSAVIYQSILDYEKNHRSGLNGFILLMHVGAGPGRSDKFYKKLIPLLRYLKSKGYHFQIVSELLEAGQE